MPFRAEVYRSPYGPVATERYFHRVHRFILGDGELFATVVDEEEFGQQRQIGKYTKPVVMMRILAAVTQENEVFEPADITPALLDAAVDRIRAEGGEPYGVEQRAKALERVAQALNAAGVVRSPFEWSIGRARFGLESRLSAYDDDRTFTPDELEAVTEAFVHAQTPRQQITTAVLALLCCAPARISEILELPVDCDAVLDPGDGYQAGLRWGRLTGAIAWTS